MAEIAPIEGVPSVKGVKHVSLVQDRTGDFFKQEIVGLFAGLLFDHFRENRR
jgi:hypothetical protein